MLFRTNITSPQSIYIKCLTDSQSYDYHRVVCTKYEEKLKFISNIWVISKKKNYRNHVVFTSERPISNQLLRRLKP